MKFDWQDTNAIRLDHTVMLTAEHDFYGLRYLRMEAKGPNGSYLMWPSGGKWSLYRDSDGALAFERFANRDECWQAAEKWCEDVLTSSGSH